MEGVFDLTDILICDTYLSVKLVKYNGEFGFVHYAIPVARKDGSLRQFGDLYKYFTQEKPGFLFAIGYALLEDDTGRYWQSGNQIFYFDKRTFPRWSLRKSEKKLLLRKHRY